MLAAFLHTNSDSYTISSTTTSPQVSGSKSCTLFLHPPLTGNLNVPLRLPRRERSLPSPPFLLPGVLNPQVLQALPVLSHSFSMTPSRAMMACHLVALTFIFTGLPRFIFGRSALYTFPSWMSLDRCSIPLPPPSPSDDLRPPPSYRCRGVAVGCQSEKRKAGQDRSGKPVLRRVLAVERYSIYSHFLSLSSNPRLRVRGPWSAAPYLFLRRRPLTTLGRPPPTVVAESQWGEPRSDASGTSVGEEEGGVGQEWQAFSSSSLGRGAMVSIFPPPDSPRLRVGGPWSAAPYLFLRRRPLTTLGRPLPTAVAESQWGEPRSDAFGTGPTRRLVTVNPDLAPSVRSGKRKVGQGGSEGIESHMGSPSNALARTVADEKSLAQKRAPMVICRYDILTMITRRRTLDGVLTGPCTVTGHLWGIEYLALDQLLKVISGRVTSPLFAGYSEVLLTALVGFISFKRRLGQLIDSLVPI
ncbi:hypothetical protein EDB84DRAFT_1442250 [Lactarius hengduanensis]|nr:hypothetical protein EDB84DRAFT_1442250 [Lactarius hengduanensis]